MKTMPRKPCLPELPNHISHMLILLRFRDSLKEIDLLLGKKFLADAADKLSGQKKAEGLLHRHNAVEFKVNLPSLWDPSGHMIIVIEMS